MDRADLSYLRFIKDLYWSDAEYGWVNPLDYETDDFAAEYDPGQCDHALEEF